MKPNPFESFDFFTPIRTAVLQYLPEAVSSLPAATCRLLTIDVPGRRVSLTDAQLPDEQLRFFQSDRTFRFLRDLAIRFREAIPEYRTLDILGTPQALNGSPVCYFLAELDRLGVRYETRPAGHSRNSSLRLIKLPDSSWVSERFSAGDTWSTLSIIEKNPDLLCPAETARLSGIALALQGRTEKAEAELRRWKELGTPANQAWALYSIAMLYARHHQPENRSLDAAEKALNEAYRILSGLDERTPDLRFYRAFNRNGLALIYFRRGEVHRARDLLRECILAVSDTADHLRLHKSVLIYNLAQCETALGNDLDAKEAFSELLRLDPDYAENRIEYANLLLELGDEKGALMEVDEAIILDPSIGAAWAIRGRLHLEAGDLPNAIRDLSRAIQFVPEDVSLRIDFVVAQLRSGNVREAQVIMDALTETEWSNASIESQEDHFILRAEIALWESQPQRAMTILREGLMRFPRSSVLQENLLDVAEYA